MGCDQRSVRSRYRLDRPGAGSDVQPLCRGPAHIAIEGFSDGASYALSVGITNGDLFTHVIAFSPGFMAPKRQIGLPRLFISHGTRDSVLPIDACSRKIVPQVQRAGYDVLYREFDGPHTVPPEIVRSALTWFSTDEQ